jgi:hypothetical protein
MAIQHLVMVEFKDGTTDEERALTLAELQGLKGKIPGLEDIKAGMNFSDRAGKIELAATMVLTDRAALEAYGPHEAHQAAVSKFSGFVEKLTVVDFET